MARLRPYVPAEVYGKAGRHRLFKTYRTAMIAAIRENRKLLDAANNQQETTA
ncbi:hypothetical protein [Oceanibaculum nanhaiense]|uniref:hypothetical protein n=1 Tax=Oceanibaculum nanhaiense TaxID=1909734 RepID=UPI003D2A94DD